MPRSGARPGPPCQAGETSTGGGGSGPRFGMVSRPTKTPKKGLDHLFGIFGWFSINPKSHPKVVASFQGSLKWVCFLRRPKSKRPEPGVPVSPFDTSPWHGREGSTWFVLWPSGLSKPNLKWVLKREVHLPQNGNIGFDPQPYDLF